MAEPAPAGMLVPSDQSEQQTLPSLMSTCQRVMFLLGAGASFPAGLPLSSELSERLLRRFNDQPQWMRHHADALNYVIAMIQAHDVRSSAGSDRPVFGEFSVLNLPSIERVVSAVHMLAQRDRLEAAPFVREWDPALSAFERERTGSVVKSPGNLITRLVSASTSNPSGGFRTRPPSAHDIDAALKQLGAAAAYSPTFAHLETALIERLREELAIENDDKVDYLGPLVELARRPDGVDIATLNYDLTVETSAGRSGIPFARGIETWGERGELSWPSDGLRLIKLHGSVDWWLTDGGNTLTTEDRAPNTWAVRGLIFGQREKLRAQGPFLDLLERFRSQLSLHDGLVVIGYSFADAHINAVIGRWLTRPITKGSRKLVVIDPHQPTLLMETAFGSQAIHLEMYSHDAIAAMRDVQS